MGFSPCGMVMGACPTEFEAPCRFYLDDGRPTRIRWFFAAPGARTYHGPSPFHPDGRFAQTNDLRPGECGERRNLPRRYGAWERPATLDGVHGFEGSIDDLAGRSPVPVGPPRRAHCNAVYDPPLRPAGGRAGGEIVLQQLAAGGGRADGQAVEVLRLVQLAAGGGRADGQAVEVLRRVRPASGGGRAAGQNVDADFHGPRFAGGGGRADSGVRPAYGVGTAGGGRAGGEARTGRRREEITGIAGTSAGGEAEPGLPRAEDAAGGGSADGLVGEVVYCRDTGGGLIGCVILLD